MSVDNFIPLRLRGLLGLIATAAGFTTLAWVSGTLFMEAATVPDMPGVALVSLVSGVALVAMASAILPLGASLRLLAGSPSRIQDDLPLDRSTRLGGRYVTADC